METRRMRTIGRSAARKRRRARERLRRRRLGVVVTALAVAWLAGCDGTGAQVQTGPEEAAPQVSLLSVSGDDQCAAPGSELGEPFVVAAMDASVDAPPDRPVSGVTVTWLVLRGDGVLSSGSTVTDDQGLASVRYRLGSSAGTNVVGATTGRNLRPMPFFARGVADELVYQRESADHSGVRHSSYVLHPDGTFELQNESYEREDWITRAYAGSYAREDSSITFDFDNGRWAATGVLDGTRLTVAYNAYAALSDLEGGVYVLCRSDRTVEPG